MKKTLGTILLAALVAGCSTSGPSTMYDNPALYYPLCFEPIQQARQLDSRARQIGLGAGKGFLTGTLAGLAGGAISALFTGNAMNIVSGAAIGAAGGTLAGGLAGGMDDNSAKKTALIALWSEQTGEDLAGLGFVGAAATASSQCYRRHLTELNKEVADGIITKAAAAPRLQEIELGEREANALMQTVQN